MSDKTPNVIEQEEIISKLDLIPHPEGGFYKETYRSEGTISYSELGDPYSGERSYSTSIYFMLTANSFSAFHRINQDEQWHFYMGAPVELHMIDHEGIYSKQLIGNDFKKGEVPQFTVPGGVWFASRALSLEGYSLVGCTVAPGFDFEDFELASRDSLQKKYPQHDQIISEFTRQ